MGVANGRDELVIHARNPQGRVEHDRHVHVPLRAASFREIESILTCHLGDGDGDGDGEAPLASFHSAALSCDKRNESLYE